MPRRPTNSELAQSVADVLTAFERFRALFSRATPPQRDAVMAGFPWHKSALGLHELRAWVGVSLAELAALKEEQPKKADTPNLRATG